MPDVVDSSGWIEYLVDGRNADAFAAVITLPDPPIVPTVSLFEVFKFVARVWDRPRAERVVLFMRRGRVVDLDTGLALKAAELSAAHQLPMADSIILATARRYGATLWTQDADFAGLAGVRYLARA